MLEREFFYTQKECAKLGHNWEEAPGGFWCPDCDAFAPYIDDDFDEDEWEWELQEVWEEEANGRITNQSTRIATSAAKQPPQAGKEPGNSG